MLPFFLVQDIFAVMEVANELPVLGSIHGLFLWLKKPTFFPLTVE
jgi:hypothetical protein